MSAKEKRSPAQIVRDLTAVLERNIERKRPFSFISLHFCRDRLNDNLNCLHFAVC